MPRSTCIRRGFPRTNARGFTLTELLVVLAVILVLVALLLPALTRAQAQARFIKCAAQMREVLHAQMMYANDYNNAKPPLALMNGRALTWAQYVAPNLKADKQVVGNGLLIERYLRSPEPLLDPSEAMADDAAIDRANWYNPLATSAGSSYIYFWQHPLDADYTYSSTFFRSGTRQRVHAKGRHAVLMDVNTEYGMVYQGAVTKAPFTAHPVLGRANIAYLDGSVDSYAIHQFKLRFPGQTWESLQWFDWAHKRYRPS